MAIVAKTAAALASGCISAPTNQSDAPKARFGCILTIKSALLPTDFSRAESGIPEKRERGVREPSWNSRTQPSM